MADRATLVVENRESKKEKAKQLRRDGWIPAVVYGQGTNTQIKVEMLPLRRVLREAGTTSLIDLHMGSANMTVVAKDVQQHPTNGNLIHVDFYEVDMKEKLVVEATLVPIGVAAPVEEGLGTTSMVIYSVEVECLPDNLISEIEVDLSRIENTDDVITVADLPVPEDVSILTDPEAIVAQFDFVQEEDVEEEEEELMFAPSAEDVEVIGRGKAEDEEEEDEE